MKKGPRSLWGIEFMTIQNFLCYVEQSWKSKALRKLIL